MIEFPKFDRRFIRKYCKNGGDCFFCDKRDVANMNEHFWQECRGITKNQLLRYMSKKTELEGTTRQQSCEVIDLTDKKVLRDLKRERKSKLLKLDLS